MDDSISALEKLGEVRVRLQSHFSIKAEHGVTRVAQRLVGSLDEGELQRQQPNHLTGGCYEKETIVLH